LRPRLLVLLSGFFSIVVIVLVALGLYGVLSFRDSPGPRGATAGSGGFAVSEVSLVTALGLSVGLAGGIAAARFITVLLYEVKLFDLWNVAAPLICLLVASTLSVVPAALARNPYRSDHCFAV
jgi:acid phosphatase family membrane protein YuiD